jgi:baculoviral IAP repeat-containing protein 2/3
MHTCLYILQRGSDSLCIICEEKTADYAVVPCGHKCLCQSHYELIVDKGECPVCRARVQTCIKIYDVKPSGD